MTICNIQCGGHNMYHVILSGVSIIVVQPTYIIKDRMIARKEKRNKTLGELTIDTPQFKPGNQKNLPNSCFHLLCQNFASLGRLLGQPQPFNCQTRQCWYYALISLCNYEILPETYFSVSFKQWYEKDQEAAFMYRAFNQKLLKQSSCVNMHVACVCW